MCIHTSIVHTHRQKREPVISITQLKETHDEKLINWITSIPVKLKTLKKKAEYAENKVEATTVFGLRLMLRKKCCD